MTYHDNVERACLALYLKSAGLGHPDWHTRAVKNKRSKVKYRMKLKRYSDRSLYGPTNGN